MPIQTEVFSKVQSIIADALYVDLEDVTREASLIDDLGAESIDFLDITFRLEKEFNVTIPRGAIEKQARGGLSEEEFAVNGQITPAGLEQLRQALPEVPQERFQQGLLVREIPSLFTAATFENMVLHQLNATRPSKRHSDQVIQPVSARNSQAASI